MAPFAATPGTAVNRLLVLRHAAAAGKSAGGDRDRALTPEGRRAAQTIGRRLKSDGLAPDHILCSPAQRARETLAAIGTALDALPPADFDEMLYLADPVTLLGHIRAVPVEAHCMLLIGHNPGLEDLVRGLAGPVNSTLPSGLPAAGLVIFEISAAWAGLSRSTARLADFVAP